MEYPGVYENRRLAQVLGQNDGNVWWVTCFAVDSPHRRAGVGQGAIAFARLHGASAVEGYPVDVARLQAARVSGPALHTGTVAIFAAAGFSEVSRPSPSRPVMRLSL
jgi:hypothetical protein